MNNNSLAKVILNWTAKQMEEIESNPNMKHRYLKAFGIGMIEGAIDGAVVMYPIVLAAGYYWKHKATKK